jgi:hypothetical protein
MRLVVIILAVAALDAFAQESVTYRPPARDVRLQISGERIAYVRDADGGVTCTTQPESRVQVPADVLTIAQCNASRVRTVRAVGDAIDAGALDNP